MIRTDDELAAHYATLDTATLRRRILQTRRIYRKAASEGLRTRSIRTHRLMMIELRSRA